MRLLQAFQAVDVPIEVLFGFAARKAKAHVEVVEQRIDAGDIEEWHIEAIDLGKSVVRKKLLVRDSNQVGKRVNCATDQPTNRSTDRPID